MEVNKTYIKFLQKLLNEEKNIDIINNQEELLVNMYLTLLSLSNIKYTEEIDKKEQAILNDFLRKLNNLKVKIQLKRKKEEITKLADTIITQYYENINILSIYIKDSMELENIIQSMDDKRLTKLIDKTTKDKMDKEDRKEQIVAKRILLTEIIPTSKYYIANGIIYIEQEEKHEEVTISEFIEIYSYLLNSNNYQTKYNNQYNQRSNELIIINIIRILLSKELTKEELQKISIPIILNYIFNIDIKNLNELDTSNFNIENIKISELYSLAKDIEQADTITKNPKWRNISIPNKYLITRIKEMIQKGMYYTQEDTFILEHMEDKNSDFKISITIKAIKEFLIQILNTAILKSN